MGALPPDQWAAVLRWLVWLSLAGVLARPVALRLLPGEGGGWIVGKLLGWLIAGWVPWCLAALHILPFDKASIAGVLVLALLAIRFGLGPRDLRGALMVELAFFGLFWLGLAAKLAHPDLVGLEKFTNMGFLAASMRSEVMPPVDAWFSGQSLNYYYVGQAMVGAWGNMAGVTPDYAYQLAMATIFALTGLGVFHVTFRLTAPWGTRLAFVLGGLAVLATLYGGNGHSILYQLFRDWMPTTKASFYYPDSTRFIGFDPDTQDKAFTEFFSYGIAAGDLHAHLVSTPLFLGAVSLVLAVLRRGLIGQMPTVAQSLAFGWMLGVALMMNSWDLAIIGLLALVALAVMLTRPSGYGPPSVAARADAIGAAAILVLCAAAVTAAPFLSTFHPFANGVMPVTFRTPIWQLLVLYAHVLPALLLLSALAVQRTQTTLLLPVAVVAVTGLLLVAIPEVVFLKDIYGADYERANTMFKLTFRAQTLLVIAACAVIAPALARRGGWTVAALVAVIPLGLTLAYLRHVYAPPSTIRSLDGLAFLGDELPLVEAARVLPLAQGEALVEAAGRAFTDTSRVSALTGQPTVIGWTGHEWLWRNDVAAAYDRANDVDRFYTTTDMAERCLIVRRYVIRYVVIGRIEHRQYPALDGPGLASLGTPVYRGTGGTILRIAPETCLE